MNTRQTTGSSSIPDMHNILSSDINDTSTCVSLGISLDLACEICKPTIDIHSFNRNRYEKSEADKTPRRQCHQLWDVKWASKSNATNST
jgi:hypothetical protein